MELKRVIKLRTKQGLAKRIDFPNNFEELIEKAQSFLPLENNNTKYQFIDEKINREICNQEDFDLMSKEYESEKTIKILVNIVEKEAEPKEEFPLSHILSKKAEDQNKNINNVTPSDDTNDNDKKEKDEESEDKIKNDIKELVRSKMKDLETNIIQDIYQSIKTQLTANEEKFNKAQLNQEDIIHNGIKCNNCNTESIKGIRYKCIHCQNFNLCSNCEEYCDHDKNHIFIKIRKPLKEEDELLMVMKRDLKYKNSKYNYSLLKKDIIFKLENKENNILVQQITLKNNGEEPWRPGAVFKCLPDSQLKGKDIKLECKVNKDATVNSELIFEDFSENLMPSVNEYFVYYQMFNSNNEAFGNISKLRILFEN